MLKKQLVGFVFAVAACSILAVTACSNDPVPERGDVALPFQSAVVSSGTGCCVATETSGTIQGQGVCAFSAWSYQCSVTSEDDCPNTGTTMYPNPLVPSGGGCTQWEKSWGQGSDCSTVAGCN